MNIEIFIKEVTKLNITPTKEQISSLETFKNLLLEYNQKFNLTALKTSEDIYLKHFYDSLTLCKVIDLNQELKVLDIGTGAGFPGLVLKIFFPNLDLTLIDSNKKKITFIKHCIEKLNLKKIACLSVRAEELDKKYLEYFDIVTSRAVANLRILAELSIPYLKVNGYFLPMKGNIEEELNSSLPTIKVLNTTIESELTFNLPLENSKRTILKIKKDKSIPSIYPRKYDKILKQPLK